MRSAVIVFPASNCDRDMAVALQLITGKKPIMVWHHDTALPDVDLVAIPGGFSYGDYLRCGTMAAHSPIMPAIKQHIKQNRKVLGVCNGFQILTEAHILPGALTRNHGLKFIHKITTITTKNNSFNLPIAHHDGCYIIDDAGLQRLNDNNQIAYRYVDNPNGSTDNIAGIYNDKRNVMGMMPHPERAVDSDLGIGTDGRSIIEGFLG